MSFYEQLEKLCKLHNVKPSNVIEQLGMSKGTMSNWKKGGTPSGEAVVRFAEHFNVSTDYLLLGSDNQQLGNNDTEWLDLIHKLPLEKQLELKGYVKRMIQESSVAADEPLKKTGTDKPGK